MALPVLVLPFLTMIFWALGGGKGTPLQAQAMEQAGLNLELPNAQFNEDKVWNKLSLYEQADRDSLKIQEAMESDPYFDFAMLSAENEAEEFMIQPPTKSKPLSTGSELDPNEARVNQKLEELMKDLDKPATTTVQIHQPKPEQVQSDPEFSADVQKLEQMMEMMSAGGQGDPEMEEIGGMLDKILDIQHPERVREKIRAQSELHKEQVFAVETVQHNDHITLLSTQAEQQVDSLQQTSAVYPVTALQNGFYGLEEDGFKESQPGNAIAAVVHDTQELVAGSTIKMRLLNDVFINGQLIEKGQFIFGTCAINSERLTIDINSIRTHKSLYPVSLTVYDLDGLEGIYIPGAITRDVAKQSSDQALQGMQFVSMDQSLGAQAASAGIQAATGLFGKKMKLVKVTVKAGYKILLKDGNAQ